MKKIFLLGAMFFITVFQVCYAGSNSTASWCESLEGTYNGPISSYTFGSNGTGSFLDTQANLMHGDFNWSTSGETVTIVWTSFFFRSNPHKMPDESFNCTAEGTLFKKGITFRK